MSEKKETKTKKTVVKPKKEVKKEPKTKEEAIKPKKVTVKKEKPVEKPIEKQEELLTKKEQKTYRVLSKIVRIFVKICRVLLMIVVPFVALSMFIIPIVFKNFEANRNIIKFGEISIVIREDTLNLKIADEIYTIGYNAEEVEPLLNFLTDRSKASIIFIIEFMLLLATTIIAISIYILSYLEKLLGNFVYKDTPFIDENVECIYKIAYLLLASEIVSIMISLVSKSKTTFNLFDIVEILVAFILYYVFKYATKVQKKIDTKIYN